MTRQETLLPGTRALPRVTVEITRYHGKLLVRSRDGEGMTHRKTFTDPAEAMLYFWERADQLTIRRNP